MDMLATVTFNLDVLSGLDNAFYVLAALGVAFIVKWALGIFL